MSQIVDQFSFQNTSNSTCTLFGYPDIQILNSDHHAISTRVTHAEDAYLFSTVPLKVVSLKPTAKAYFVVEWVNLCNVKSPSSAFLRATPSGQTSALTTVSEGIYTCNGVDVSPVSNEDILLSTQKTDPRGG